MNTEISTSAKCYGLYDNDMLIGFCAVIHFPHPKNRRIKHIHRLVIHPDYQGIGLGKKLLNFVTQIYCEQKFDVFIITSARNLIYGLNKDSHWNCVSYQRFSPPSQTSSINLRQTSSKERITASFKYKNVNNENNR